MMEAKGYIVCPHCGFKHMYPEEYAKEYEENFLCDMCCLPFTYVKDGKYWNSWR